MSEQTPLLGALGLCRKAGSLLWGADRVQEALHAGKARLVLLAADASPRTRRHFVQACGQRVDCRVLPQTGAQLAALSSRPAAVFAVTDANLARLCAKHLANAQTTEHIKEVPAHGF